ncbi:MAG: LysM domain-containing protein [Gammaproteobacteria bacterium]|nr:MAG: LysM domain-containing protein [Gammaproteobacteria bacterium]
MKTLAICSLLLALLFISQPVQSVELKDDHPSVYIVKKGDTLWDISGIFLDEPWLWPEIWHVNPQVGNPHLIYPGDELKLVYIDGKPRIVLSRDEKLTPQMRVLSQGNAITTIPLDVIRPFLYSPRILSEEELDNAPYILSDEADRLIYGQGNKVYVRGIKDPNKKGFSLFRKGDAYIDPETEELLGFEAIHLGSGRKVRSGDPATMIISESVQEIFGGDRALPFDDQQFPPQFMLRTPDHEVKAYLIAVYNGVTQIGTYDVVILNKGARDRLEVGHVLTVMQSGRTIEDEFAADGEGGIITLPSEIAGAVMVFRTFEKTSLGLIMRANRSIHVLDTAVTPK